MSEFLTAKQVITLLKIDRTTLYRMLKENRIKGVKIGSHWRFTQESVNAVLNGHSYEPSPVSESGKDDLPVHCIQPIQEVFSDIIGIAALTTDNNGTPITEMSRSCEFCKLITDSEKGMAACVNSWKNLRFSKPGSAVFNTCHAGLNYSGAKISIDGMDTANIITGQFLLQEPGYDFNDKVNALAVKYGIDKEALLKASEEIKVLPDNVKPELGKWLTKIADSFGQIGSERKQLVNKLKNIAEISSL